MLITPLICIPLLGAAVTLIFYKEKNIQQWISSITIAVHLFYAFAIFNMVQVQNILVEYLGGWAAPVGITLVVDKLSALMVIMTSIVMLAVNIYSRLATDAKLESQGYFPVVLALLAGLSGTFVTGDLFNLYVWFEVILMSSFVLLSVKGSREQLEGGIKYVALNLFSSVIFLCAAGLIYGLFGTLNLADLSVKVAENIEDPRVHTFALMLWIAFAIKAAIFPFYSWLPSSYHTPPIAVGAIFAGLLTKVGIYSMIRVFLFVFNPLPDWIYTLLIVISLITMVSGVLGAYVQTDFRRILAFSSVSQVGFMMLGISLRTDWALAATILFIFHHAFVKSGLFITAGICEYAYGTFDIRKLGGVLEKDVFISIIFFMLGLCLVGVPFSSGFLVKILLIKAAIETSSWVSTGVIIMVSFMTLLYTVKIWTEVFWNALPDEEELKAEKIKEREMSSMMYIPAAILLLAGIIIGLNSNYFAEYGREAAKNIYYKSDYINSVLDTSKYKKDYNFLEAK